MLKCGDYTLERPVGWGRTATYYSAFAGEEAGELRLVVRYSRSAERRHVQSFLKSAAEQQTAVSTGCRRIAPVLDFGVAETGHAYRVNLGSEISLAELIQAGNTVDHEYLRTIISGTLRGLTELRDKFKRPHGNLSAGNILLDRNSEVLLTDLSPSALEGRHSDDLRNLGAVIYQVVRHSLKIGFLSPPLERSPEWTNALGDHADDWRELTNRLLLTKTGEGAASLERAVKELKSLESLGEQATVVPTAAGAGPSSTIGGGSVTVPVITPRARKRRWRLAMAGLTLLGLGGVTAVIMRKEQTEAEKKVITIIRPDLRDFKKLIPVASTAKFEGGIIRRLTDRAGTPREMWDLIALEWQAPAELRKIQAEWQKPPREWAALAEEITPPAELSTDPGVFSDEEQDKRLADALRNMEPTVKLLASAEALEKQWERIEDLCKQVADDKEAKRVGLPDFTEWARFAIRESGGLAKAEQRVAGMNVVLRDAQKFLREDGARVHSKALEKGAASVPAYNDSAFKSGQLWPQRWLDEAKKVLRPVPATIAAWETKFKEIKARIAKRPDTEQAGYKKELEELQTASLDVLAGDTETAFEKRIEELRLKIKDPLEDLDNAFWARVQKFNTDVRVAATSDDAKALLAAFKSEARALLDRTEYRPVNAEFFARNNFGGLPTVFKPLEDAEALRGQPSFGFTGKMAQWTQTVSPDGSHVDIQDPNGTPPIRFYVLTGLPAALAATETSLALARSSGVRLPPPGDGPLGFRDDASKIGIQKWFWRGADPWLRDMARYNQNPNTIIPRHDGINNCPITWISADGANQIAQVLGARLPTTAEWANAVGAQGPVSARLRGVAFDTAQRKINELRDGLPAQPLNLDLGAFRFGIDTPWKGTVVNDGFPWFVPVTQAGPNAGKFLHLIGNAAEWIMNPGNASSVAGGSAITPQNGAILTPTPTPSNRSFSDVTFRLAVTMIPGSPDAALNGIKSAADNLAGKRPNRQ